MSYGKGDNPPSKGGGKAVKRKWAEGLATKEHDKGTARLGEPATGDTSKDQRRGNEERGKTAAKLGEQSVATSEGVTKGDTTTVHASSSARGGGPGGAPPWEMQSLYSRHSHTDPKGVGSLTVG